MIRIAVCDDERAEIEYVTSLIRPWADERGLAVRLTGYPSAESFLFAYEDGAPADILLLDIQMGGMDGVSLAKTVRAANKEAAVVFITGYMDYIADGYDVEALHYLIKPVTAEKLRAVLDRAVEKLARSERALLLSHAGVNTRVPLYEIRYLAVWQNYVTVHAGAEYTVKRPLGELEKELDDSFFRTGRSHIVNLRYLKRVTKTEAILSDGAAVPLSRGLYGALNRAVIERL